MILDTFRLDGRVAAVTGTSRASAAEPPWPSPRRAPTSR